GIAARAAGAGPLAADALATPAVWWLALPILGALPMALYVGASAEAAPRPAPRATPVERVSRTKCPGCGTLVPYVPTGQPVDVVCPACGRAGRVL
ncbi:MAG TPA: hypothetical protein VHH36_03100, partial [Candidatus Thermoplasmatota archaeon]|nr:hypothetical protein [Candidatus Thermoplasmatota archaeon]